MNIASNTKACKYNANVSVGSRLDILTKDSHLKSTFYIYKLPTQVNNNVCIVFYNMTKTVERANN